MFNIISNKKAMTLPELIIVILLVSVIIGAAITPFIMQQEFLKRQMAKSQVQDDISIALAYINKDVFRATTASISGSTLTLQINDNTGVLSETIVYSLDGSNIKRAKNAETKLQIASNIQTVAYVPKGNNYIQVNMVGEKDGQVITKFTGIALRATRA